MADNPKGTTIPKQRLAITNIEIDVSYAQGTKHLDRVHAINLSLPEGDPLFDKPLRMTIFSDELKSFIRGKTSIVADIEERTRPDSDYGPDRTIVQAYDDQGNPVSKKQGGGGNWRRSLKDDLALEAFKNVSTEGQAAIAQVGELVLCQNSIDAEALCLSEDDLRRIIGKYWRAVEKGLDNYLTEKPKTTAAKPKQEPASKPVQKAQDSKPGPDQAEAASTPEPPAADDVLKNIGDLLTRCKNYGVARGKAFEILGIINADEIGDLEEAWAKVWTYIQGQKGEDPNDPDRIFD